MGDLTKALQVLGKFEEIRSKGELELDFTKKQFKINPTLLPGENDALQTWYREAFLYYKFKALSAFDENRDAILFTNMNNGHSIARIALKDLGKEKIPK